MIEGLKCPECGWILGHGIACRYELRQEISRLREALMEARQIFYDIGPTDDDKASNLASKGVFVTTKAIADSQSSAPAHQEKP